MYTENSINLFIISSSMSSILLSCVNMLVEKVEKSSTSFIVRSCINLPMVYFLSVSVMRAIYCKLNVWVKPNFSSFLLNLAYVALV